MPQEILVNVSNLPVIMTGESEEMILFLVAPEWIDAIYGPKDKVLYRR